MRDHAMMRLLLIALPIALLAGCVTTKLSSGAEAVRVTNNADVVRPCEFVANVNARDRMNGGLLGQDAAEENTIRRLQNEAHAMGANTVHINWGSTGFAGSSARGEAYRCP